MSCNPYNLLRRTFLVVAAVAAVATIPGPAFAAGNVTKTDGSVLCASFDSISLGANGLVVNNCSATPAPTGATAPDGTFTVNGSSTIDATKNQYLWYSVSRSGSLGTSSSAANINLTATGGCTLSPSSVSFTAGSGDTYGVFGVVAPKDSTGAIYNTTCTVAITQQSPALTLGNGGTGSIQVNVINGTGTAPPVGGTPSAFNCPTVPKDANPNMSLTYGGGVTGILSLNSGQIGYTTLPLFSSSGGSGTSGKIATAISTNSPTSGTVEVSINHCPGVIDTNKQYVQGTTGGSCYHSFPIDASEHDQFWFESVGAVASSTDTMANTYGICEAYATNGPWYVNVRYTFPDGNSHNMAWQWQFGYFSP